MIALGGLALPIFRMTGRLAGQSGTLAHTARKLLTSMTTDELTKAPKRELFYGTTSAGVQVVTLLAGEYYTAPAEKNLQQEWVVMSGQVNLINPNTDLGDKLRSGKYGTYRRFTPGLAVTAKNPSAKNPAKVMMLSRYNFNNNAQTVPQKPVTEVRPWGNFTVLGDEPDFKLKELVVSPGGRLSLQRHEKRSEHWFILSGSPEITLGRKKTTYKAGDYVHIPRHSWHRIDNRNGTEDVMLIELQTGVYFGEDDIERKQDDYGRN